MPDRPDRRDTTSAGRSARAATVDSRRGLQREETTLIDFRYHIVSLIAVFLALALGLFLGSTTLQSTVTHNLHQQARNVINKNKSLEAANTQLSNQLKDEQNYIAGLGPYAVANRLPGESVALVSAPGVSSDDRNAATAILQAAGATVTANVQLQSAYVDPSQDAELGALASQSQLPGHPLPAGNGSTEMSSKLAAVLAARPGRKPVKATLVEQTLSVLSDGKFISVSGNPPTHAASLAVFLVAQPNSSTSAATAQSENTVVLTLAADLRNDTTGEVLAGPVPSPEVSGGAVAAARNDSELSKTVSTVAISTDSRDQLAGRVAIVLALADSTTGAPAAYGLGQTPPVPSPSPTSTS